MREFNYFLYVGSAYPHKNLLRTIKSIMMLTKTSKQEVKFLIVSARNVFTKRLERAIKKFGAEDVVKLLGYVSDEELDELYKNSLGFLYSSLDEGFGLPGLEAMKAGTVVLASNIPVFKEVYEDKVFYFDPTSVESIEKAMRKVMEMKIEERKGIIEEGRKFIKKYSWEKMARETLRIYEGIKHQGN